MLAPATLPLADREHQQFTQLLTVARREALTLLRSLLTATADTPGAILRERRLAAQAILRVPVPVPAEIAPIESAPPSQPAAITVAPAPAPTPTPTPPQPTRARPVALAARTAPPPSHPCPTTAPTGPAARLRASAGSDRPRKNALTG